ncbi:hydroxyphenylacetyl-CoA thioesterase PaaI [Ornithinimicrobium murale]|uniref:hydroxyphenylacetyl-CoA thioesterase PaaI n=1 Tax=Ornithinimicrobium murale TaxID=1050153 RepID=UPI001EE03DB6|nr:hydroxyphenylacetyl-CoA thioesterase PaaI [Ornithinimicrobium murale]
MTDPDAATPDLTHVRAMWADDRASAGLGIECLEVTHDGALGSATARMSVSEAMVNGHAICHGGFIFALADSAFALACNAGGSPTVAATCEISFVAAARLGDVLLATAAERTTYGRNGITDVTVTRQGDAAVVAEFRGRSRSIGPRAPAGRGAPSR